VKAGGEGEMYKGHFPCQAGRVDEMGECGTKQDGLARPLVNGKRVVSVSLSGQHMMFSHHHRT